MDATQQPGLQIAQVFLNSARFAHRADALSLPTTERVQTQAIEIGVQVLGAPDDSSAAIVVRVSSKEDPNALYSFEVEMIGIVSREAGKENLSPQEYAARMGPAALYPFLRETVANLTLRGRFGPVWLKPFNFVAAVATSADQRVALPVGALREMPRQAYSARKAARKTARKK